MNSFRRGVGCSSIIANLTALLAATGRRIGLVDINIQSPSQHLLFGLSEDEISFTLNDFMWDRCDIKQVVHEVTLPSARTTIGPIFLIPISTKTEEFAYVLRQGYNVDRLNAGLEQLGDTLDLDVLLIDTQPGLNDETMVAVALSDVLLIVLRTDQRDYQGTGLTVQIARELKVPRLMMIVNEVPSVYDQSEVKLEVAQTYDCEVGAVLPHSDSLMAMAGMGIFALQHPDHDMTAQLKQVAASLLR